MSSGMSLSSRGRRKLRRMLGLEVQNFPYWMCREWTDADLAPVPEGWSTGPPDFVGVGVPKAGTTWLYSLLLAHPQIEQNRFRKKEPHFYTVPNFRDVSERTELYRRAFAAPAGSLCGEWSGSYLGYPLAIERLAAAAPETKILVSLRNPVDRTISGLNQVSYRPEQLGIKEDEKQAFLYRYTSFPDAVRWSMSTSGDLEQLLTLFPRDSVHVMQYERCRRDTRAELERTFEFLGVDPKASIPDTERRVNERPYKIARPTDDERKVLRELLEDEMGRLAQLFPEIDLELWN